MKDLSMHILDIVQNSITASATQLYIKIHENSEIYSITIEDNGKGMSRELLANVADPYFTTRTTRKIGLGIPLLKQNAERTGGSFNIESEENKGTKVEANFIFNHPDRLPIGDIAGTIVLLTSANPNISIKYNHETKKGSYLYNTDEINLLLDGVSISEPSVIRFLKEMINENLTEIEITR